MFCAVHLSTGMTVTWRLKVSLIGSNPEILLIWTNLLQCVTVMADNYHTDASRILPDLAGETVHMREAKRLNTCLPMLSKIIHAVQRGQRSTATQLLLYSVIYAF